MSIPSTPPCPSAAESHSQAGGGSGMLFACHLLYAGPESGPRALVLSTGIGVAITLMLLFLYVGTVLYTTSDRKLGSANK